MAGSEEELKSLLIKVKEDSEKVGLKQLSKIEDLGIWSHHFMENRWIRKQWKVTDFIFLGSKITTDGDYSHENKRHLLLGRKAITNLDSILKNRDNTLPTKMYLVKPWFF